MKVDSEFEVDGIKVTLEWIQGYSYHIDVNPSIPLMYDGSASVMLSLSYNTGYNVSVIADHEHQRLCGYSDLTIFNKFFNYCEYSTQIMLYVHIMQFYYLCSKL